VVFGGRGPEDRPSSEVIKGPILECRMKVEGENTQIGEYKFGDHGCLVVV